MQKKGGFLMKIFRKTILGILCAALLLTAGCTQTTPGSGSSSSSSSQQTQQDKSSGQKTEGSSASALTIKVYYPNEDGTHLLAVKRQIRTDKNTDKYMAALQSLLEGTKEKGQVNIIPKAAKLRSVKVDQGVAKVDFTQELVKSFSGGSTGESLMVGSIVDTLTEFPEVKSVQILINGKTVETIAGHMDTSVPIKRMDKLIK